MPETAADPLVIKRYASRRLYNTETSDYVTLDDITGFIRDGRDVRIVDLKTGDDLTRQYLLQIIAEHESRGENILPVDILTNLVREYATNATSVMPRLLSTYFDFVRDSQNQLLENAAAMNRMTFNQAGYEVVRAQQELFAKAMSVGLGAGGAAKAGSGNSSAGGHKENSGKAEG